MSQTFSAATIRLPFQLCLVFLCGLLFFVAAAGKTYAQERLIVASWNLESGESSDQTIAARVRTFQGVDMWGLSEVAGATTVNIFEVAAEHNENADFRHVLGTTGGADRLAIVYNDRRFNLERFFELENINQGGHRAPLVAVFVEPATNRRFQFMVNHLARGNQGLRHRQGTLLNDWVRTQTIPVVAVGDYNFDWEVEGGDTNHDRGFDNMTAGGEWRWVRPARLIKTQCSPDFNSVLDFVFVSDNVAEGRTASMIVEAAGDCEDDAFKPDHRIVLAGLHLGNQPPPAGESLEQLIARIASGSNGRPVPANVARRQQILQRIQAMERELRELRQQLRRLPN